MRLTQCDHIVVLVPPDRVRKWALTLAEILRSKVRLPVTLLRQTGMADPKPLPCEALERRLFPLPRPDHTVWMSTRGLAEADDRSLQQTLVVNLTELAPSDILPRGPAVVVTPAFNGKYSADALIGSLHNHEMPHLSLSAVTTDTTQLLHGANLTMHDRNLILPVLNAVLARAITVITQAVGHLTKGTPLPEPSCATLDAGRPANLHFWFRRASRIYPRMALHRLVRHVLHTGDWCIAYRRADRAEPPDLDLTPRTFSVIPSAYDRFYADPMLFHHDGETTLFFEDYDYGTGRGRISCAAVSEGGRVGEPREALSRPYHLSYPFVFSHGGAIFMVPETSANRTVELYQAEAFPDRWTLRAILMDEIEVADATPFFDENTGLWWLFGTVTEFGSSSYDSLSIFFSENLEGPWRPHVMNPVKFDPFSSRPAGPLIRQDGRLLRPAQDSSRGYGSGLAWCEIRELTPTSFREEVVARHIPSSGYRGLHTYTRGGGFEAVDFQRRRWRHI